MCMDTAAKGPTAWRRDATWRSRGIRRLQHEVVVLAGLDADQPEIIDGGRTQEELEDYVAARCGSPARSASARNRSNPAGLPRRLRRSLPGGASDDPSEAGT